MESSWKRVCTRISYHSLGAVAQIPKNPNKKPPEKAKNANKPALKLHSKNVLAFIEFARSFASVNILQITASANARRFSQNPMKVLKSLKRLAAVQISG